MHWWRVAHCRVHLTVVRTFIESSIWHQACHTVHSVNLVMGNEFRIACKPTSYNSTFMHTWSFYSKDLCSFGIDLRMESDHSHPAKWLCKTTCWIPISSQHPFKPNCKRTGSWASDRFVLYSPWAYIPDERIFKWSSRCWACIAQILCWLAHQLSWPGWETARKDIYTDWTRPSALLVRQWLDSIGSCIR